MDNFRTGLKSRIQRHAEAAFRAHGKALPAATIGEYLSAADACGTIAAAETLVDRINSDAGA